MHLISDFCNRINQASAIRLKSVIIKNCKLVISSCFILYKLGYILYFTIKNFKYIIVFLKYSVFGPTIRGLLSLSKPSLRFYLKHTHILRFSFNNHFGAIGFMAISTNKKKIMLDFDCVSNMIGGVPVWAVY